MYRLAAALSLFLTVSSTGAAVAESPDSASLGLRRLDQPAAPRTPTAPTAPAAPANAQPRLYSLHRDYGETPDRTVLPPAFFLVPGEAAGEGEPAATAPVRDRWGRPVADSTGPDKAST